jgi:hypothetical protein
VNPFAIQGPAMISFSGGRTSGYMLRRCLDALPLPQPSTWFSTLTDSGVYVLFANTGKEREETLKFVHEVETRWEVPIVWLERLEPIDDAPAGFRIVSYETAARDGEPFAKLIEQRNFLPNPVTRFCTSELKIRVMRDYMRSKGFEHWTNVVGLRADEPRRVAKMREREGEQRWTSAMPLADADDLCMLKGQAKRERIIRDRPDLAAWWIEQERKAAATFRPHSPPYAALAEMARRPMLFANHVMDGVDEPADDDANDCHCHD